MARVCTMGISLSYSAHTRTDVHRPRLTCVADGGVVTLQALQAPLDRLSRSNTNREESIVGVRPHQHLADRQRPDVSIRRPGLELLRPLDRLYSDHHQTRARRALKPCAEPTNIHSYIISARNPTASPNWRRKQPTGPVPQLSATRRLLLAHSSPHRARPGPRLATGLLNACTCMASRPHAPLHAPQPRSAS